MFTGSYRKKSLIAGYYSTWSEHTSSLKPRSLSYKTLADDRCVKYNIISGTSVSCQHVAGTTALLKIIHPDQSPAAIKSAIMTTAVVTKYKGNQMTDVAGILATPFNYGLGQLNRHQASDLGIIYDATVEDYLIFLCSSGINANNALNTSFQCPESHSKSNDLNYPSIAIVNLTDTESITRTVINVGGKSEYTVSVDEPSGVSVNIHPKKLSFQTSGEKQTFTVQFTVKKPLNQEYVFGSYTWNDGIHKVRSPIAVSVM